MKSFASKRYNYLYFTKNLMTGVKYIGVHSTNPLDDGYLGSGLLLNKSIKKHGECNFRVTMRIYFDTLEDAYAAEKRFVGEECTKSSLFYNIKIGGIGGCGPHSEVTRKKISESNKGIPCSEAKKNRSEIPLKAKWQVKIIRCMAGDLKI